MYLRVISNQHNTHMCIMTGCNILLIFCREIFTEKIQGISTKNPKKSEKIFQKVTKLFYFFIFFQPTMFLFIMWPETHVLTVNICWTTPLEGYPTFFAFFVLFLSIFLSKLPKRLQFVCNGYVFSQLIACVYYATCVAYWLIQPTIHDHIAQRPHT